MSSNLYQASRQWASRPADERFFSLEEMFQVTRGQYESSCEAKGVQLRALAVHPTGDDDLVVSGPSGATAKFTDHSFRQLCSTVSAPARYLAKLPAELAARCMNEGLNRLDGDMTSNLFFHQNGSLVFRGMNSDVYQRVWNFEVAEFCLALREMDPAWRVPPARPAGIIGERTRVATEADVLNDPQFSLSVQVGDLIAPAGLYASSHDVFVFMVNIERTLRSGGETLSRGFFISGSEVAGVTTHKVTTFLYDHVCGNHIVWGAQDVYEVAFRHVGRTLRAKVAEAYSRMRAISEGSAQADEARLQAARDFRLADDKDGVIDLVFERGIFTRRDAEAAFTLAEEYSDIHGDPCSAWGFASGATRLSQQTQFTDRRHELDRAAGRVLSIAF